MRLGDPDTASIPVPLSDVRQDEWPPGVRDHVVRYGGTDESARLLALDRGRDRATHLAAAALELEPSEILAITWSANSRLRARHEIRQLSRSLRSTGFEPLGWHWQRDGRDLCLYARRVAPEYGLSPSLRGGPPRPPRIPERPVDVEAAVTRDLYALGASRNLCDWMFAQYAGSVRGAVAEVGPGIGTFSKRILAAGAERLLLVEPAQSCMPALEQIFSSDERVRIVSELLPDAPSMREGGFQLVVCQNVLEHVDDDAAAVEVMASSLAPGGHLALLAPAHSRLFGSLDDSYGHIRRYSRARIRALFEAADLDITNLRPFNALGIAGWWVKNRRPGATLDESSLRAYEALVRLWRPVEDRLHLPFGLSLVARGERRSTHRRRRL
jgi:SAM-dependent methyltransferase